MLGQPGITGWTTDGIAGGLCPVSFPEVIEDLNFGGATPALRWKHEFLSCIQLEFYVRSRERIQIEGSRCAMGQFRPGQ
jgi:hypothetical protein